MKNLKYFPFERNNYFYGKLLSVDDFKSEQKYINDKRRMLNRFLHGTGVVTGMNVVRVDDTAISVEMGFALDFAGREIVIDTPVIKKLNMINGFESDSDVEDMGYMYLCIDYAEEEKNPVHSIANADASSVSNRQFNKMSEGYKMYLTSLEPDIDGFWADGYYRDKATIYWGNGIRIKQIIPKFVKSDSNFELKLIIENMGAQQPFSVNYDLDLTCITADGKENLKIEFDERNVSKAGKYFISHKLKTTNVVDTEGKIEVKKGSFTVKIGEKVVNVDIENINKCRIVKNNPKEEVTNLYYKTAMEEIVKNTFQQSIYLAKIGIIRAGSTFIIESIENMPFNQYVFNTSLSSVMNNMDTYEIERLQALTNKVSISKGGLNAQNSDNSIIPMISTGTAVIELGIGGRPEQKFFTESITHGLGLGAVQIILGQLTGDSDDSERIFGQSDIFENEENDIANISMASKVNVKDGTFKIGIKINETTNARKVRIDWTAIKDRKETVHDLTVKSILIKPDMKDISVRETCYFEAVFTNISDKRIKWSLKENGSGTIDANGMYIAPNVPGVYEIIVSSIAYPEIVASTYVVVREER